MSPYAGRDKRAFWRSGVTEQSPLRIDALYRKKFAIASDDRIATAGSCFAQHIGRQLQKAGFRVVDAEPAPPGLDADAVRRFGYGLFSARYGNIYTAAQLLQLAREALGELSPAHPVWQRDGRFFDAQRPAVEPQGFERSDDVMLHRRYHLQRVRDVLASTDLFIFTFGLTEAWTDRQSGTVYPTAPGTIAGEYDPSRFMFKNFTFDETYKNFALFRDILRAYNNNVRFIVTVSPVPLTATASDQHVLSACTYSKAVLRAVAGQLCQEFDDVDYFPAYEAITAPFTRGMFYEADWRSVSDIGVAVAMRLFFSEHGLRKAAASAWAASPQEPAADPACEDILLDAFAPR